MRSSFAVLAAGMVLEAIAFDFFVGVLFTSCCNGLRRLFPFPRANFARQSKSTFCFYSSSKIFTPAATFSRFAARPFQVRLMLGGDMFVVSWPSRVQAFESQGCNTVVTNSHSSNWKKRWSCVRPEQLLSYALWYSWRYSRTNKRYFPPIPKGITAVVVRQLTIDIGFQ